MASFIAIPNSRSMCNWLFCLKKRGGKKEKKKKSTLGTTKVIIKEDTSN